MIKINNKGYTLLELMMYMLVAVMVIGFAFQMIGRTQKQYGQQRSMSKLQGEGRNAIYILAADIQNCGFKNYLREGPANVYTLTRIAGVTTAEDHNPPASEVSPGDGDASFYAFNNSTESDSILFFKGSIDINGVFEKVVRIKYVVKNNGDLIRYEWENPETTNPTNVTWNALPTVDSIIVAENIESLQFEYSADKVTWVQNPTGNKDQIQAIRISMLIRTNRTVAQPAATTTHTVGGETITVTGNYLRRLYTETIEVVNNGL